MPLVNEEWLRSDCDVSTASAKANSLNYPLALVFFRHDCRLSYADYDLDKGFTRLAGEASIRDDSPAGSTPVLEVLGVRSGDPDFQRIGYFDLAYGTTTPIDVDLTGVLRLRVQVTFGNEYAHAVVNVALA